METLFCSFPDVIHLRRVSEAIVKVTLNISLPRDEVANDTRQTMTKPWL